ncbi:MAG: outer membrane protein, partial [Alphaproteobacteria bacterium]
GVYATVYGQASWLGSTSFNEVGNAGFGSGLEASFNTGFGFGANIGFQFGNGWATELEWNYRSHPLDSLTKGGATLATDGDVASNIFFINGLRRFVGLTRGWTPYLGLGVGWVQEIDLDLNTNANQRAWSEQGKFGVQFIAGGEIPLSNGWSLITDVRFLALGGIDMPAESGVTGRLSKPDYNPVSLQVGLKRLF